MGYMSLADYGITVHEDDVLSIYYGMSFVQWVGAGGGGSKLYTGMEKLIHSVD